MSSTSMTEPDEEMEVVAGPRAPKRRRVFVHMRCKRREELRVSSSLLIKSSSYFAAMFSKGSIWEESSKRVIDLSNWSRSDLVTIVLCLKYKTPDPILQNVNRYFEAINYFSLRPLADRCIEHKIANISNDSVLSDLKFAERYSIAALKESCMHHLLNNLPEILAHPDSNREVSKELIQNLLRHDHLSLRNEDEVLSIIDLWCSPRDSKVGNRAELLHCVRFAHLTEDLFEECRRDAQCLEVPEFRVLLENPRWSDLDEKILSGRSFRPVHMHTVGRLKPSIYDIPETLLYCSASDTLIPSGKYFYEDYVDMMMHRCRSVRFGDKLLYCSEDPTHRDRPIGRTIPYRSLHEFPCPNEVCPTPVSAFPHTVFAVAAPIVVEGDFCIARLMTEPNKTDWTDGCMVQDLKKLMDFEVVRLRDGGYQSKRFEVRDLEAPWDRVAHALVHPQWNTLCSEKEWTMLLVPQPAVIFAIDEKPASGPIIRIPSEFWDVASERRKIMECFSDLAIVGNVAFVLLKYTLSKICSMHNKRRRAAFYGRETVGSILVYDLLEGNLVPGQSASLNSIFAGNGRPGYENCRARLKVVHKEVFLVCIQERTRPGRSEFPMAQNLVYRIDRSPGKLRLTSVLPDTVDTCTEVVEPTQNEYMRRDLTWEGTLVSVDSHPCKYASMLQRKAHAEDDPIEREKLRRFIW